MKEIKDRLQEALLIRNITRSELSERSGVPKPMITDYLKGRYKPKQERIHALARALDVSPYWLMGYDVDINFTGFILDYSCLDDVTENEAITDFSVEETEHIKKYRTLDGYGKRAVDDLLNNEYKRCASSDEKKPLPTIKIKHSVYKASAGFGFDLEDRDEWDEIEVPDTQDARKADFAVTIKGNSMEPIYSDGDIVLVEKCDTVNIGETGIFIVNGSGFIKQYGGDRLISINSDYEDILFTEGDFVKCAGKVIGIA